MPGLRTVFEVIGLALVAYAVIGVVFVSASRRRVVRACRDERDPVPLWLGFPIAAGMWPALMAVRVVDYFKSKGPRNGS